MLSLAEELQIQVGKANDSKWENIAELCWTNEIEIYRVEGVIEHKEEDP